MLTAKRARGAQHIRENSDRKRHRLEGIIPIIEDWHAKMCLVGVSHCYLVCSPMYQTRLMCSNAMCVDIYIFICIYTQKKWSHKQITSQKHE